jgi:phage repressor protein C with HTH and peptisase S24 domain
VQKQTDPPGLLPAERFTVFDRLCSAYGVALTRGAAERLAERTGTNINTVKGWRQRKSVPLSHLSDAARETGRSLDWLLTGRGAEVAPVSGSKIEPSTGARSIEPKPRPAVAVTTGRATTQGAVLEDQRVYSRTLKLLEGRRELEFVLVPRYGLRASAGEGRPVGEEGGSQIGEIAFESEWMRRNFGRAGQGFAMVDVAGDSMESTLWDGETVVIDLQQHELVSGGIYLLRDGDELLVKRLQRLIGGAVEVVSDNRAYRSQVVDDRGQLQILGRLVWPRVR